VILLIGAVHDLWQTRSGATRSSAPLPSADTLPAEFPRADRPDSSNARSDPHPVPLLDLNRAEARDLEALPGIGPVLAQRILDQRRRVGSFRRVDDLLGVRGLGPHLLARLEPLLSVGSETRSPARRAAHPSAMHSAPSPPNPRADSASVSKRVSR
jgi:predicted flap endonuclease-1-like 5' DNA nuclease